MHFSQQRVLQTVFLATGVGYLLVLLVFAVLNTTKKNFPLASQTAVDSREELTEDDRLKSEDSSELSLEDFQRKVVRNGSKIWEISAKGARYFKAEGVTHVNDADLVVYRKDGSQVKLRSSAARLHILEQEMDSAELEGDVSIAIGKSLLVQSEVATYNDSLREILTPGKVSIFGEGFKLTGSGLEVNIDTEKLLLKHDVKSEFVPGTRVDTTFGLRP